MSACMGAIQVRPGSLTSLSCPPSRLPDVTHVMKRPGLPRFSRSSASVYYTERKPKNYNGEGLGTRLSLHVSELYNAGVVPDMGGP